MSSFLSTDLGPENPPNVASRRIADKLKTAILDGELAPGSRILQEDLATQFGASRIPVREALRTLQSDGLVMLRANLGAWVTRLNMEECLEIYLIREHLEPLLIADSIENCTDEDIDVIMQRADRLANAQDIGEYFRYDREFHLETYRASTMPYLHSTVERLWNVTQPYRSAYTRLVAEQDSRWILDAEHRLLAEAITRRNVVDAKQIIQIHVRRTRVKLADHPEIFTAFEAP
jgi:DNA-binding GntR family transcriptional regulator